MSYDSPRNHTNTSFPETCPADTGLNKYRLNTDFTSGSLGRWNTTAGTVTSTDSGAKFTVSEQGDAPTIESEFYIFFGHVDVKMKAANGTGIVSTWILESDDLDEIDWVSPPASEATNLHPPKKSALTNAKNRNKSAPMTLKSKPTTSAKETQPPMTAAQL